MASLPNANRAAEENANTESLGSQRSSVAEQNGYQDRSGFVRSVVRAVPFKAQPFERAVHLLRGCSRDVILAELGVLDLVDVGVAVTDRAGRLLFANRMTRQFAQAGDGIALSQNGVLETKGECGWCSLSGLAEVSAKPKGGEARPLRDTVHAVPRMSGKRPLTVLTRSLRDEQSSLAREGPAFLMFILDPERPVTATENELRELYEFTTTEARLAQLLMSGTNFEECCEQMNIRASTARMHLGNLFAKTDTRRQGQLVALLLKSHGMVHSWRHDLGRPKVGAVSSRLDRDNHLQQAETSGVRSAILEALDWLDVGILVTNRVGKALFVNRCASNILARNDGIDVTAQGTLIRVRRGRPLSLSALSRSDSPIDAVLAVPRPSGKRSLAFIVHSINEPESEMDGSGPAALVFIVDPDVPVRAAQSRLRSLYGFTATEAWLASLMMEGRTIDDCCGPLNICASTARRHLANIFAKTKVRHQGHLISLLWKSTGAVGLRHDDLSFPCTPLTTVYEPRRISPRLTPTTTAGRTAYL